MNRDQINERIKTIQTSFKGILKLLRNLDSERELSLAITKIQEADHWVMALKERKKKEAEISFSDTKVMDMRRT